MEELRHAARVEAHSANTRTVTIGEESRPSVTLDSESPLRWRLDPSPHERRLRTAAGLDGSPPVSILSHVTFEVIARSTNGDEVKANTRLGFAKWRLKPVWLPIELSIPPSTQPIELEFRVDTGAPAEGLPQAVLAHPRVFSFEPGRSERPNIVLLSIDTLRADRLSLYGYERATSPNIERRAKRDGITFFQAVAAAPWTLPSHISMLTGVEPTRHGVNRAVAAPQSGGYLADLLAAAGYETIAFTAGAYMAPEFGVGQGFHRQLNRDYTADGSADELEAGIDALSDWFHARPVEPFFAFFHTYEVHSPYLAREPYFSRLAPSVEPPPLGSATLEPLDRSQHETLSDRISIPAHPWHRFERPAEDELWRLVSALYDSGVAYTDAELETFWRALEESGLQQRTVVVLTSDHGEALGDNGRLGHDDLYDEVLRVPLVVWLPDGKPYQSESQVRSIDIAPTLLRLAGVPVSPKLPGRALIEDGSPVEVTHAPDPAWSYAGARGIAARLDSRTKYIWRPRTDSREDPRDELFDLLEDPHELDDLSAGSRSSGDRYRRGIVRKFADELRGIHMRWTNHSSSPQRVSVRSDVLVEGNMVTPDCAALERRGVTTVEVVLAPSSECLAIIEQLAPGPTTATFQQTSVALELADTDRVDHAWGTAISLTALWQGDRATEPAAAPAVSDKLERQLRALGYVN